MEKIKVIITNSLYEEINKKFKAHSTKILKKLKSIKDTPSKGKPLGTVGGILIKELKFESFRFYFIVDGHKLKWIQSKEISQLILQFVRMSDKKKQQKVIEEIKLILRQIGPLGFE
ncbi:hypothetical protein HOC01_00565 [archaeon]|jgi:hypothetical protein|nr:hypothetical protein [archaeon]MBT6698667.1 hypothetical protein [archaeon]